MIEYRGNLTVEPSDFQKHGYIGTYAIGECRCEPCTEAWLNWDTVQNNKARNAARRAPKRTNEAIRKARYRAQKGIE